MSTLYYTCENFLTLMFTGLVTIWSLYWGCPSTIVRKVAQQALPDCMSTTLSKSPRTSSATIFSGDSILVIHVKTISCEFQICATFNIRWFQHGGGNWRLLWSSDWLFSHGSDNIGQNCLQPRPQIEL